MEPRRTDPTLSDAVALAAVGKFRRAILALDRFEDNLRNSGHEWPERVLSTLGTLRHCWSELSRAGDSSDEEDSGLTTWEVLAPEAVNERLIESLAPEDTIRIVAGLPDDPRNSLALRAFLVQCLQSKDRQIRKNARLLLRGKRIPGVKIADFSGYPDPALLPTTPGARREQGP